MASSGLTFGHFCHDSAIYAELEQQEGTGHILVLGLRGAGKRSLLANLRIIQHAGNYPYMETFAAAVVAATATRRDRKPVDRQRLTVNNAHCLALDLGGASDAEATERCQRLQEYVSGLESRADVDGEFNPWGQIRGVLFVVDTADWRELPAAREELLTLSWIVPELAYTPLAVFFNRGVRDEGDVWYDAEGVAEVERVEFEGLNKDCVDCMAWNAPLEAFIGSVPERRGYREALEWLLQL